MKIMITVKTMQEMGRLCYELGSRHISAEISENIVKCPFDEGLFLSLKTLGFNAEKIGEDNFENISHTKIHQEIHRQSVSNAHINSVTVTTHSETTTMK
ncbi:MAG: hypothetical protein K2J47_09820 [Ruminococcus sp.]|nr:hypothetical protein [Ruminococcus sp.]